MSDEITPLIPLNVEINDNYIEYRLQEGDELVYKSEINNIVPNSGITMENVEYPVPAYYINLADVYGETLRCGNIINTFFAALKSQIDNTVIIMDFQGIKEISDSFCSQYYKHLLTTKNKIIIINQSINVSNMFAQFVLTNSYDIETNNTLK